MKKLLLLILLSGPLMAADNEIFLDQSSGASNTNIDLEQLGSGNIIGGSDAAAGSMTALKFTGTGGTLDINQIGDSNKFLGDIAAEYGTTKKEIDKEAIQKLQEFPWTGNIRELRNVIERLVILGGKSISADDIKKYADY